MAPLPNYVSKKPEHETDRENAAYTLQQALAGPALAYSAPSWKPIEFDPTMKPPSAPHWVFRGWRVHSTARILVKRAIKGRHEGHVHPFDH